MDKNRTEGAKNQVKGTVKEVAGKVTGNKTQELEGKAQKGVGKVQSAVGKAKTVADLFCGIGPFALRLAEQHPVAAFDSDKAGIAALDKARRFAKGIREVTAKPRDLFRDPLTQFELNYEAVVLDPPRAGAEAQVRELAKSRVKTVVMVACDARTFARDAAILVAGGYQVGVIVAVDQFTQSANVEIAATFRRY